ncbi:MAG: hypothetical protein D6696_09695, partial [Acidobacteria bacterium]
MAREIVVDASCLLNLVATGRAVELLEGLDAVLVVPPQVTAEPLYLSSDDPQERFRRQPIDLRELEAAGRLRIEPIARESLDVLVRCAEHLHDADAAALTLAVTHRLPLATDDGRQRQVARQLFPEVELLTTSEILAQAIEPLALDQAALHAIAAAICRRANYL